MPDWAMPEQELGWSGPVTTVGWGKSLVYRMERVTSGTPIGDWYQTETGL
jgi:hypothetical protein